MKEIRDTGETDGAAVEEEEACTLIHGARQNNTLSQGERSTVDEMMKKKVLFFPCLIRW